MTDGATRDGAAKGGIRWSVLLPLIVFAVVAGFFAWGLMKGNPRYIPSVLIGKPAPAFDLPPLPGLKDAAGNQLPGLSTEVLKAPGMKMVNFFASWCTGCIQEHPFIMSLAKRKEFPIYGIAYKDPEDKSLAWLEKHGNPYSRVGVDRQGRTGIDFGVYGIPETFFIDGEGRIIYKFIGPLNATAWEKQVLPALAKARERVRQTTGAQPR